MREADLDAAAWPAERLAELVSSVAQRAGLAASPPTRAAAPPAGATAEEMTRWLAAVAAGAGADAVAVRARYAGVGADLRAARCLIAALPGTPARFLAILTARRGRCVVLTPDDRLRAIPIERVRAALVHDLEEPLLAGIETLLSRLPSGGVDRDAVRAALLERRLAQRTVERLWRLELSSTAPLRAQLRWERIPRRLAGYVALYGLQYALWLVSWWIIGLWALRGRIDWGWAAAWALLLSTAMPMQLVCAALQGNLSTHLGAIVKERLLLAGMRFNLDELRLHGPSQLLARILETQVIETAIVNGFFVAVVGAIELAFAAVVLGQGVAPAHAVALLLWAAVVLAGWLGYWRLRGRWTAARLAMTHETVERMVGYRTRLAQQRPEHWHDGEDHLLSQYLASSRRLDRVGAILTPLPYRGWTLLGLIALTVAAVAAPLDPVRIAISLGGIILGARALNRWGYAFGQGQIVDAVIAWRQAATFLATAANADARGVPAFAIAAAEGSVGVPVLTATDVVYAYPRRPEPVVRRWNLHVNAGDRLLLEGASGSGKSTLVALLAGMRRTRSGTLLLRGVDPHTLGAYEWRRRIVAAPQFHENHIFAETFAFNLLMGRGWPPSRADVDDATAVCRELGLDDLVGRMPAGMFQLVGETGWQLSHGERSRVYIARALLQKAELVVLDESFAALDPDNFERSMSCVLRHAPTLLVVAHP
jgi:ATP-binding cassette subfamily B protein